MVELGRVPVRGRLAGRHSEPLPLQAPLHTFLRFPHRAGLRNRPLPLQHNSGGRGRLAAAAQDDRRIAPLKTTKADGKDVPRLKKARGRRPSLGRVALYVVAILAAFYSAWPLLIMALEGYAIDLSAIFAGKAVRLIYDIPYYSGGIFPTPIHYLDALIFGAFPMLVVNSLIIALISIAIALAVGIPIAYIPVSYTHLTLPT